MSAAIDILKNSPPPTGVNYPVGAQGECVICRKPYTRRVPKQITCGADACRYALTYWRHRHDPACVAQSRARFRRWAEEHRNVKRRNPWLAGPPPYGAHLPGGAVEIFVSPPPQWPIVHRNIRALHGMVSDLTGPHDPQNPQFSLIPWKRGIGWGAYIRDLEIAQSLAGGTRQATLFDRRVDVRFGPLYRLRAPQVAKRGHQLVRLDAITPVCVRSSTGQVYTVPTAANLLSTLCTWIPMRLGLDLPPDSARLMVRESRAFRASVPVGGKLGDVSGWVGHVIVDVNATGRWLLEVAQQIGLGGKTAYGFGRVRVTALEAAADATY